MNRFIALLLVWSALCIPRALMGCSCVGEESASNARRDADRVFWGKVVKEELLTIPYGMDGVPSGIDLQFKRYTLKVIKAYKGKLRPSLLTVTTGLGRGDCGFAFQLNQEYLVYADWRTQYFTDGLPVSKYLYTDVCKRTTARVQAEIKALKARGRSKKRPG